MWLWGESRSKYSKVSAKVKWMHYIGITSCVGVWVTGVGECGVGGSPGTGTVRFQLK